MTITLDIKPEVQAELSARQRFKAAQSKRTPQPRSKMRSRHLASNLRAPLLRWSKPASSSRLSESGMGFRLGA